MPSGQVLIAVEGNKWILPYVIKQRGAEDLLKRPIIPMSWI